jgi:uncharacterized membrane protein
MGKGSRRRPTLISEKEETLRWDLAMGKITREEFDRKIKEIKPEK